MDQITFSFGKFKNQKFDPQNKEMIQYIIKNHKKYSEKEEFKELTKYLDFSEKSVFLKECVCSSLRICQGLTNDCHSIFHRCICGIACQCDSRYSRDQCLYKRTITCQADNHFCTCRQLNTVCRKKDHHDCICIVDKNKNCKSQEHYCSCKTKNIGCLANDYHFCCCTVLGKSCISTKHECSCTFNKPSLCKALQNHKCTCQMYNQNELCQSEKHQCICGKFLTNDHCQSIFHRCICQIDQTNSCKAINHICHCKTEKDKLELGGRYNISIVAQTIANCKGVPHECICDSTSEFLTCRANTHSLCSCFIRGNDNCLLPQNSLGHKCTCMFQNGQGCLSKKHLCICQAKDSSMCKFKEDEELKENERPFHQCSCRKKGTVGCPAIRHACSCNIDPEKCLQTNKHKCICSLRVFKGQCKKDTHLCCCPIADSTDECLSTNFHRCVCLNGKQCLKTGGHYCSCALDPTNCKCKTMHKCICKDQVDPKCRVCASHIQLNHKGGYCQICSKNNQSFAQIRCTGGCVLNKNDNEFCLECVIKYQNKCFICRGTLF